VEAAIKKGLKAIRAGRLRGRDPFSYLEGIVDNLACGRTPGNSEGELCLNLKRVRPSPGLSKTRLVRQGRLLNGST
jgi:hypothetical protein